MSRLEVEIIRYEVPFFQGKKIGEDIDKTNFSLQLEKISKENEIKFITQSECIGPSIDKDGKVDESRYTNYLTYTIFYERKKD